MAIVIRGARVLTFDNERREYACADVLTRGTKIIAVGPGLDVSRFVNVELEGIEEIDGAGKLVMPGLINAHLHSPGNFLKGAMDDLPLELFMLFEVPPMGDTPLSARLCYLRAMLGAMEMLKLGVTSVHDDAFFNPAPLPECIDAIMAAYRDVGMRATVANRSAEYRRIRQASLPGRHPSRRDEAGHAPRPDPERRGIDRRLSGFHRRLAWGRGTDGCVAPPRARRRNG